MDESYEITSEEVDEVEMTDEELEEAIESTLIEIELIEADMNSRQRKFVDLYIDDGMSAAAAAWEAGYKVQNNERENARFVAYQVKRSARVQKDIELKRRLRALREVQNERRDE